MSKQTPRTYASSIARLKVLVARLESADVDVDELEAVVKESVALIETCRTRLRTTQSSVDTLLAGLEEDASSSVRTAAPPAVALSPPDDEDVDPFADL